MRAVCNITEWSKSSFERNLPHTAKGVTRIKHPLLWDCPQCLRVCLNESSGLNSDLGAAKPERGSRAIEVVYPISNGGEQTHYEKYFWILAMSN